MGSQYSLLPIRKILKYMSLFLKLFSILKYQGPQCNIMRRKIFLRACSLSRFNVVSRLLDFDLTFYRIVYPSLVKLAIYRDDFALAQVLLEKGFKMSTSGKFK